MCAITSNPKVVSTIIRPGKKINTIKTYTYMQSKCYKEGHVNAMLDCDPERSRGRTESKSSQKGSAFVGGFGWFSIQKFSDFSCIIQEYRCQHFTHEVLQHFRFWIPNYDVFEKRECSICIDNQDISRLLNFCKV